MPIPFIAGAILGAAAVIAYNKKGGCIKEKINNFNTEDFAKKVGEVAENTILKVKSLTTCNCCEEKKEAKKAAKKAAAK